MKIPEKLWKYSLVTYGTDENITSFNLQVKIKWQTLFPGFKTEI